MDPWYIYSTVWLRKHGFKANFRRKSYETRFLKNRPYGHTLVWTDGKLFVQARVPREWGTCTARYVSSTVSELGYPVTQITHETKHGILCTQMIAEQQEMRSYTRGKEAQQKRDLILDPERKKMWARQ